MQPNLFFALTTLDETLVEILGLVYERMRLLFGRQVKLLEN